MLRLTGAARTDVGSKRSNNEDAYLVDPALGLYIVADGMGGAASGEVASQMVVRAIYDYMHQYLAEPIENAARFDFYDPGFSARANTLMQAIHLANRLVFDAGYHEEGHRGMGSTLAALLRDTDDILVVHVGDSRVYRMSEGRFERLTIDHRLADDPMIRGVIDPGATLINEMGNVLTRAMGVRESVEPDVQKIHALPGDQFLLCSDGLSDMVDEDMIARVMAMERSLDQKVRDLIELALAGGGRDNVTAVLVGAEKAGKLKGLLHKITKSN